VGQLAHLEIKRLRPLRSAPVIGRNLSPFGVRRSQLEAPNFSTLGSFPQLSARLRATGEDDRGMIARCDPPSIHFVFEIAAFTHVGVENG
jgi:hypothetical protein